MHGALFNVNFGCMPWRLAVAHAMFPWPYMIYPRRDPHCRFTQCRKPRYSRAFVRQMFLTLTVTGLGM